MTIMKRGKYYYLKRRVPARFKHLEPREYVYTSLHTDSASAAEAKATSVWSELTGAWEAELAGSTALAQERFDAAQRLAEHRGFQWQPVAQVAELPTDQLLERVEAATMTNGQPSRIRGEAFLGGAEKPALTVSAALKEYWALSADALRGKSADQERRWANPRKKAVGNFLKVVGDIPLDLLSADHMLDFREWWWDRIELEGLTPNSANKDFTHFGKVIKTVARMKRLGFAPPVDGYRFKDGQSRPRPPFPTDFIRDKILAPGALGGMNDDARLILLGMINTGYRPSEGAGLLPEHIVLDAEIPHIDIQPVGRALKTRRSRRKIPLVGVSLEAFRAMPGGAPRYRNKASVTLTINNFLRGNGLTPTPEHTCYGLRHSFEDRLLVAGVDERVRRDLMGHALKREEYGEGGGLKLRHEAVSKISL